jgi:hypothetical protein
MVWLFVLLTPFAAGCHDDDLEERAERVYLDLREREDEHHAAVMHAGDPLVARDDTLRYQGDMGALLGDMLSACSDLMDADMMGRGQYDGVRFIAGRMGDAIDDHAAAMGSLDAIEPMHDDCEAHHLDMTHMMYEMRHAMPDDVMRDGMM